VESDVEVEQLGSADLPDRTVYECLLFLAAHLQRCPIDFEGRFQDRRGLDHHAEAIAVLVGLQRGQHREELPAVTRQWRDPPLM
jgi:hypothetical protein